MSIVAKGKLLDLLSFLLMFIGIVYFMKQGDKGKKYFIRRIPGVDALDESIERAAEMGKAVHFAVGDRAEMTGEMADQTIAGLEILRHIAKQCARLKTRLLVSLGGRSGTGGELVPLCREIVRDQYEAEGGEYSDDIVRYISGEKTGFDAGMQGIMRRENIGSNIMTGPWAASWIAPTGIALSQGIMNISGTARTYWIAVFTVFADYFLVGEELYAAGAVLSGNTSTLASLKLADYVKIVMIGVLILGVVLKLFGSNLVPDLYKL